MVVVVVMVIVRVRVRVRASTRRVRRGLDANEGIYHLQDWKLSREMKQ